MALTWLLAIATYTNVTKRRGDKEEWAYLTIASAAHVFKTLTNSLECQVGTLSSAELDRSSEMKNQEDRMKRTRVKPVKGCPPNSIEINHYRLR